MKNLVACALALTLLVGCTDGDDQSSIPGIPELRGRECFVVYTRDALGISTDESSVSAETVWSGASGALAARGTLRRTSDAWVVLENSKGLHQAIPTNSILSVIEIE